MANPILSSIADLARLRRIDLQPDWAATAEGLDRDDAVIKRRVRQKYLLITEEEDAVDHAEDALDLELALGTRQIERLLVILSLDQCIGTIH